MPNALFANISGKSVPGTGKKEINIRERLLNVLEFYNPDLITDMRNYNRCNIGSKFDEFFSHCDKFIENWTATDERRNAGSDNIGYFPIA